MKSEKVSTQILPVSLQLSKPIDLSPASQISPRDEIKNLFRKIAEAFRKVLEWFKSFFERRVLPVIEWMKNYEKDVVRHKHNQYTRTTWSVNRDSRRKSQVIDNRPRFSHGRGGTYRQH